jgi:hypothetical protein
MNMTYDNPDFDYKKCTEADQLKHFISNLEFERKFYDSVISACITAGGGPRGHADIEKLTMKQFANMCGRNGMRLKNVSE